MFYYLITRIPHSRTVFELRLVLGKRMSRALEASDLNGWTLQDISGLPVRTDDRNLVIGGNSRYVPKCQSIELDQGALSGMPGIRFR